MSTSSFNVIDLFSGAGGMSCGFSRHPNFRIMASADAELGKPSTGHGKLQCNSTYTRNIRITPSKVDLSAISSREIARALNLPDGLPVHVLLTTPPCTGFSRTNPQNHLRDDKRNSLVRKSAEIAIELDADIVVMENARELIQGNFKHHYEWFKESLEAQGYKVYGKSYMLTRFGLPQIRERAIALAVKRHLNLFTLDDLWSNWTIQEEALTVRRAFSSISDVATGVSIFPAFSSEIVRHRIEAVPKDGGSWMDLYNRTGLEHLLTNAMKRIAAQQRFGSYPDVYGRMAWSKPAPTIKRECSHVGNGRYAHPEEDRLCSVREMAILQGFPNDFVFEDTAISNMYRHIGDAVPPLISFQIAHLCHWMLTGRQPDLQELVLPETSLKPDDIERKGQQGLSYGRVQNLRHAS